MSRSRLLAGVALAALCLPVAALAPVNPFGAAPVQAQTVNVGFQLFFEQLEPHGVWVHHSRYQYVFCPTGIDADWRPYTDGRWLYMEGRGWYFASDEPHAWATYHYGRWFPDSRLGWCWVPGTKWAPAWVSWRRSDNVVGWAPLPPERNGVAVSLEVSNRDLPAGYWVYVPTAQFVEPDLRLSVVIGNTQPQYYTETRFLGPVVVEGDVVVNNVIDVTYIEQTINQEVIVYQPETASSPDEQSVTADNQIIVFDQDLAEAAAEAMPPEAVEEEQALEIIEAEGGTAGATAEIAAEGEAVGVEAPGVDAGAMPEEDAGAMPAEDDSHVNAGAAAEVETHVDEGLAAQSSEAPAAEATPSGPASPDEPAAKGQTTEAAEPPCPPETMQDGVCQIIPADRTQPDAVDAAPAETATPVEEPPAEGSVPEPVPAADAEPTPGAADVPDGDAATAQDEVPADELPCPIEVRVDGKCPPLAPETNQ
jgi:hypothetical protein